MSVFDLRVGESAKIISVSVSGGAAARLKSLGITEGKTIRVLAYSLFKSSVMIGCGAVRLGLRKATAKLIGVQRCA